MHVPSVDLLVLGAGWTSTFLLPLLTEHEVSHAATSTTGRDDTLKFRFDPTATSADAYQTLPSAKTVLITFPLTGPGQSKTLTSLYRQVHGPHNNWIQLGSTGIYKSASGWTDRHSPYDTGNARAIAEDELMSCVNGVALNLSGLYGGTRDPRNWLGRVFRSKDDVRAKGAVHLIHGQDVARAIIATHMHFSVVAGARWILTDLRVYDWWDLAMSWGGAALPELEQLGVHTGAMKAALERRPDRTPSRESLDGLQRLGEDMGNKRKELEEKGQIAHWVGECMMEEGVRALPRDVEDLGRRLDGREFWSVVDGWPSMGRVG